MILFLLFISFWIGLSLSNSIIIVSIILVSAIIYIFIRFKYKLGLICLFVSLLGVGIGFLKIQYDKDIYKGFIVDSKENYYIVSSFGEKLYVYEKNNDKEIGDFIQIDGYKSDLEFTRIESEFDFKEYLNKKGIYSEFHVTTCDRKFTNPIRIKKKKNSFLSNFEGNTKELCSGILFATSISGDVKDSASKLNLNRLISLSGIYVYSFLKFIEKILSKFSNNEKYNRLLSFIILQFYLLFTFPKFSIVKISFLFLLRWINKYKLDNKISYLDLIGLSGLIFLIINPHLAVQDSFTLGYCIPLLIYFVNNIYKYKKTLVKKIAPMIWIPLFFIPYLLKFNNQIVIFSTFYQIILSPIFILFGILGLACFYNIPLKIPLIWLGKSITFLLNIFQKISIPIYASQMSEYVIFVYYLIFIIFLYYYSIGFKPIYKTALLFFTSLICLYLVPIKNQITEQVSFVNVGQGDCCLIRKQNSVIMIDTGGLIYKDIATCSLIPYLKKNQIYDIDVLITTHDDFDHSGAVESLQNNFKVKNYFNSKDSFPFTINGITFNNYNNNSNESNDENNKSLVIGFKLCNKSFLIMGDAPIEIEKDIMKNYNHIDCDILKVGHHGSDTSSCDSFIKYLNPDVGIISCGLNNKYHHPNDKVINILRNNNVKILRTDYLGTITYSNYIKL